MSSHKVKSCANGTVGYDIKSGRTYVPQLACKRIADIGHILCTACRLQAGGILRGLR